MESGVGETSAMAVPSYRVIPGRPSHRASGTARSPGQMLTLSGDYRTLA